MNNNKKFDKWVSDNFRGLSAFSLMQFIRMEREYLPEDYIWNMVCDLYRVFTNNANDACRDTYDTVLCMVESCAWL